MSTLINQALEAHRQGRLDDALMLYEATLRENPLDQMALYGQGVILLSRGDVAGLKLARRAIVMDGSAEFEKGNAADSVARLLLSHKYYEHLRDFLDELELAQIEVHGSQDFRRKIDVPVYLEPTAFDSQLNKDLKRYSPFESTHYVYAIDIVGGCNLRCPSCPVSYSTDLPKGLMKRQQFEAILDKIRQESPDENPEIWLFNWSEPMLHPLIGEFVRVAKGKGFFTFVSTNLNISSRIDDLIKAEPDRLKISLSSLKQDIYSKTHARGDIEQVVQNMGTLSKLREAYGVKTEIWLGHHLYRNTVGETESIKALANQLGFKYGPSPAIIAPIERVMTMLTETSRSLPEIRDQLLYDPTQIQAHMQSRRSGTYDCELRFNMTSIRYDGTLDLCCATTQKLNPKKDVSFMDFTHKEIEALKYHHSFCAQCIKSSLSLAILDQ